MTQMNLVQAINSGLRDAMRQNEDEDWWLVRLASQAKAGDEEKDLAFDLVVVGIFNE